MIASNEQGFDFHGENVEHEQPPPATFEQFIHFYREWRDWHTHVQLRDDLVEHLWTHIINQSIVIRLLDIIGRTIGLTPFRANKFQLDCNKTT